MEKEEINNLSNKCEDLNQKLSMNNISKQESIEKDIIKVEKED